MNDDSPKMLIAGFSGYTMRSDPVKINHLKFGTEDKPPGEARLQSLDPLRLD